MTKALRNIGPAELATRFQKGASGNPKGRATKKVSPSSDPLEAIWNKRITLPVNGRKRRISYRAFCVKQKVAPCIQGDLNAIATLLALRRDGVTGNAPKQLPRIVLQNEDGSYDE